MQKLGNYINGQWITGDGEDLYPTLYEKAAALGESLVINHPFVDGNKEPACWL